MNITSNIDEQEPGSWCEESCEECYSSHGCTDFDEYLHVRAAILSNALETLTPNAFKLYVYLCSTQIFARYKEDSENLIHNNVIAEKLGMSIPDFYLAIRELLSYKRIKILDSVPKSYGVNYNFCCDAVNMILPVPDGWLYYIQPMFFVSETESDDGSDGYEEDIIKEYYDYNCSD